LAAGKSDEGLIGYWNLDEVEGGEVLFLSDLEVYEDGSLPEGWSSFSGSPTISSEKAFSGKHSIKLDDPSTTGSAGLRTPKVAVKEGVLYTAYSRYFNESGNAMIYFEFWDGGNNRIKYTTAKCDAIGQWGTVTASYIAPAGAKYATLLVYSDTKNVGVSYHDDLMIASPAIIKDVSGNGRHGFLHYNAYLTKGRFGNAAKFDGVGDYAEIPYDPGFRSPDAISIEAWIYPTPPHQKSGTGGIINNVNGAANSRILISPDGTLRFELHGWREGIVGPAVSNETWSHVAYVYDGEEEKIYINGKLELASPYSIKLPVGTTPITLGWGHTGDNYHYNGLIDEVKIYNRALSPEEVAHKATNPPRWEGLVSYPNPASMDDVVKLACFLDEPCDLELIIYDEGGRQVNRFKDRAHQRGYYQFEWDGKNKEGDTVLAGVYIAVITIIEDGKPRLFTQGLLVMAP
jgi:hypothetical protein